jgi:hypothetical protein
LHLSSANCRRSTTAIASAIGRSAGRRAFANPSRSSRASLCAARFFNTPGIVRADSASHRACSTASKILRESPPDGARRACSAAL